MFLPSLLWPPDVSHTSCWSSAEPPGWWPGCCWEHLSAPSYCLQSTSSLISVMASDSSHLFEFFYTTILILKKLRIPNLYHGWEYLATHHLYGDSFTEQPRLSETVKQKKEKKKITAVKQMPQRPCAKFHDIALKKNPDPSKLKCVWNRPWPTGSASGKRTGMRGSLWGVTVRSPALCVLALSLSSCWAVGSGCGPGAYLPPKPPLLLPSRDQPVLADSAGSG